MVIMYKTDLAAAEKTREEMLSNGRRFLKERSWRLYSEKLYPRKIQEIHFTMRRTDCWTLRTGKAAADENKFK